MKKIALILLLCLPLSGQRARVPFNKGAGGGGSTWTLVQLKYFDSVSGGTGGSACTTGNTTCTVTVSSIGANHALVVFGFSGNSTSTALSSVNGETWSNCPTSCLAFDSVVGTSDMKYVTSATGGETSFTCTFASNVANYKGCGIFELAWSGTTRAIDVSGSLLFNGGSGCTSCTGVALTLTGSSDAIVQISLPANTLTAISSPYSTNAQFYSGSGEAVSLNTSSGTAPTWTQNSSGIAVGSAIAIKGS